MAPLHDARHVCTPCRHGEYGAAIELYSRALDVGVPAARLLSEGPRRAVYHANRAAAYLARADAVGGKAGELQSIAALLCVLVPGQAL